MGGDMITLNVGGHIYVTTRTTLTKYPDSMLGAMFSGHFEPAAKLGGDGNSFFIDRDGLMFRHVLNFLRSSVLCLPQDFKDMEALMVEADYYQITALTEALEKRADQAEKAIAGMTNRRHEYIEIVSRFNARDRVGYWQFWGDQQSLRQVPEICNYIQTCNYGKGQVDRSKLFRELNQLGFTFQHTSMVSAPATEAFEPLGRSSSKQVEIYRWIYTRNLDDL